uniref:CCHC-type domain-containing protein n=1 Tax=Nicotiana tabacum TaxID=4097 RepID=A0A1S4CV65_TOBAC
MECQSSSKARSAGNSGGSSGGGGGRSAFMGGSLRPSQSFSQSSMSAQSFVPSQGNRGPHQQGRPDRSFQQRGLPCPKYGRMHLRACFMDLPICYMCGVRGHIQRDCRSACRNMGR